MVDKINFTDEDRKIVLSARGKKTSGVSWELKQKFLDWQKSGKIVDRDGNGIFDSAQASGLANKLAEIHKKALSDDDYWKKMPVGRTFDYTEEQMLALLDAAGFDMVGSGTTPVAPVTPEAVDAFTTTLVIVPLMLDVVNVILPTADDPVP